MLNVGLSQVKQVSSWWFEPRASDRDEAFRERVIRSSIAIILVAGLLSFASTLFVYHSPWSLISFPTVHIVALSLCLAAGIAVAQGQRQTAGWLLVMTILLGAGGILLLARKEATVNGVFL